MVVPDPKKIKIKLKIMDCEFIGYAYNNYAYQFLILKSSIEDIHINIIMESRNATLFKDVFPLKKVQENHSLKRRIETISNNNNYLEDDEVELRRNKREKKTKIFGKYKFY